MSLEIGEEDRLVPSIAPTLDARYTVTVEPLHPPIERLTTTDAQGHPGDLTVPWLIGREMRPVEEGHLGSRRADAISIEQVIG
ncbi:hypothetical protein HRbin27_01113 [bacterium HR27]|nr:hypothetical protein HRbin27_01113 [bacterium HR27]